ncbi:hypothetical protein VTO73DRAFT_10074 [Trametes versicolor]
MFAPNTGSSSSALHVRATHSHIPSPFSNFGSSTPSTSVYPTLLSREFPQAPDPSGFPFPSGFPSQLASQWGSIWSTALSQPANTQNAAVTPTSDGTTSGPSTTLIIALSVSLGIPLVAAAVVLVILRRRRARRAAEHSLQAPVPYDRLEAGERKSDEGLIPSHARRLSGGRYYRREHARDARPSRDSVNSSTASIRSTAISDVSQNDTLPREISTTVRKGSVLAEAGSLLGPEDDPSHSTPEPPSHPNPEPVPTHAESQPTGDSTHPQAAGAEPSPRSREPPAVPTMDRPDTVLLRLPAELAHRVMATIAGESAQGREDSRAFQDSQDSEPPPAYEPRSADIEAPPPG